MKRLWIFLNDPEHQPNWIGKKVSAVESVESMLRNELPVEDTLLGALCHADGDVLCLAGPSKNGPEMLVVVDQQKVGNQLRAFARWCNSRTIKIATGIRKPVRGNYPFTTSTKNLIKMMGKYSKGRNPLNDAWRCTRLLYGLVRHRHPHPWTVKFWMWVETMRMERKLRSLMYPLFIT